MKKELVLSAKVAETSAIKTWLKKEAKLHSLCLGHPVTNATVLRIMHAEVAGTFVVFSPSAGATTALICCTWFIISIYLCKKGGMK